MEKIQQAIERARQQRATVMAGPGRAAASTMKPSAPPASLEAVRHRFQSVTLDPTHLRQTRVVAADLEDARADIFRSLRTQIVLRLETLGGRSVAILSARDGEGKTLVATNLAFSLARRAEGPVFLVDMDFRRPSVCKTLGIEAAHSVSDYVEGSADLEEVVVNVENSNLYVLPQMRPMVRASELIASTRARDLVRELVGQTTGGYVVVDCPPLLLTDEPLAVQTFVDSCMLVVEQRRTRREDVQRAAELLDETKYIGCVMNHADSVSDYMTYGYR